MKPLACTGVPLDTLLSQEWLAVNQLGGFASSTVAGMNTRKYHGLLVAAMAPPVRRMVILSRVEEIVRSAGHAEPLSSSEYPGTIYPQGHRLLRAFSSDPHPRWAYQGQGWTLQKSLQLLPRENTVCLSYSLLAGDEAIELDLRPLLAMRSMHHLMYQWNGALEPEPRGDNLSRVPPTAGTPEVFFAHAGRPIPGAMWYFNTIYRREAERGYSGLEDLWMPGSIRYILRPGDTAHFVCSTDPINLGKIIDRVEAAEERASVGVPLQQRDDALSTLIRAADAFVVKGRQGTTAVISQYPWSAPSLRDALVAFPGLFLTTGKFEQAKEFLDSTVAQLNNGLLPSEQPEDGSSPLFKMADTSLWFINAVHDYLRHQPADTAAARRWLDPVLGIIAAYRRGTWLGISVDADGLLATRSTGQPTTWMNAKVGDWVITQHAGRPVELNALWYNALKIAATLAEQAGRQSIADDLQRFATSVQNAFNRRFWNDAADCCFDVIDAPGPDAAIRPNQLLAAGLPHAVLTRDHQSKMLATLRTHLLTPFGLRTLSQLDPNYRATYSGDIVRRDRAYHQGSVFPWLLGPFASAHLRVHGRSPASRAALRNALDPCLNYLQSQGLGQLPELFDGDPPHHPGGTLASALSIAEVLRAYVEGVLDQGPTPTHDDTLQPTGGIVFPLTLPQK